MMLGKLCKALKGPGVINYTAIGVATVDITAAVSAPEPQLAQPSSATSPGADL